MLIEIDGYFYNSIDKQYLNDFYIKNGRYFVEVKNEYIELFEILGIIKSKECSYFLQLLDKDYSYKEALKITSEKFKKINIRKLETEINKYI